MLYSKQMVSGNTSIPNTLEVYTGRPFRPFPSFDGGRLGWGGALGWGGFWGWARWGLIEKPPPRPSPLERGRGLSVYWKVPSPLGEYKIRPYMDSPPPAIQFTRPTFLKKRAGFSASILAATFTRTRRPLDIAAPLRRRRASAISLSEAADMFTTGPDWCRHL